MAIEGAASAPGPLILGALSLILLCAWRGWRLGIVRQALSIVAVIASYICGWCFGGILIPLLRPLGFPDRVLTIFGGVLVGLGVYLTFAIISGVVFKRTAQQSVGVVRFGFGAAGALLGAVFGLFLVFVCLIGLRLMGTVAEAETRSGHGAAASPMSREIASLYRALHDGPIGGVVERLDPVPAKVYDTLGNLGQLASNPQAIDRLARDKAVQRASAHPKIIALRDDPEIARAIREGDFMALLRHPKLIEAANDPSVMKLLSEFDLQKSLEGSLKSVPRHE